MDDSNRYVIINKYAEGEKWLTKEQSVALRKDVLVYVGQKEEKGERKGEN